MIKKLYNDIMGIIDDYSRKYNEDAMEISFIFKNLQTGEIVEKNSEEIYPAASMIKLWILWCALKKEEEKTFNLSQKIRPFDKIEEISPSMGVLHFLNKDIEMTYRDILYLMIVLSDNNATNLMIDTFGLEEINKYIRNMGALGTVYGHRQPAGELNITTGKDMLSIYEKFLSNEFSEEHKKFILETLRNQRWNTKLPYILDNSGDKYRDIEFLHKTGEIVNSESDSGIIIDKTNGNQYIVSFIIKKLKNREVGRNIHIKVGEVIFDYVLSTR